MRGRRMDGNIVYLCIAYLLGGHNDMVMYDIIGSRYCLHITINVLPIKNYGPKN